MAEPRHGVSGRESRMAAQVDCTREVLGVTQTRRCTSSIRMTYSHNDVPLPLEHLDHTLNALPARVFWAPVEPNHHTHPVLQITIEICSS